MTPTWPLTPEMHYRNALHCGQGFYSPNLVSIGHSWTIWPLDDLWPVGSQRKVDGSPQLAKPYPRAKFQLRRSHRSHSDTDRHGKFINYSFLTLLSKFIKSISESFLVITLYVHNIRLTQTLSLCKRLIFPSYSRQFLSTQSPLTSLRVSNTMQIRKVRSCKRR